MSNTVIGAFGAKFRPYCIKLSTSRLGNLNSDISGSEDPRLVERDLKRLMSSSALAHVQVHCSFRRLHQTWSIAVALFSRAYHSRTTSLQMSNSETRKFRHRRTALIFAVKERPIDRTAREEFSNSLHNILKNRSMHGLVDRGDAYVSVRELVRYSILALKIYTQ